MTLNYRRREFIWACLRASSEAHCRDKGRLEVTEWLYDTNVWHNAVPAALTIIAMGIPVAVGARGNAVDVAWFTALGWGTAAAAELSSYQMSGRLPSGCLIKGLKDLIHDSLERRGTPSSSSTSPRTRETHGVPNADKGHGQTQK